MYMYIKGALEPSVQVYLKGAYNIQMNVLKE